MSGFSNSRLITSSRFFFRSKSKIPPKFHGPLAQVVDHLSSAPLPELEAVYVETDGAVARIRSDKGDLVLVGAISIFAWGALLAPGYFLKAHDAPHSVFFLLEFDKAFRDGAWYPRWGIDFALGYGYPLFS